MKSGDYTTIILLILIILILMIGLNLNRLSSFAIKTKETFKIYPEVIKAGQYITLEINPPLEGFHKKVSFCNAENKCKEYFNIRCGSFKFTKHTTDEFKTYGYWQGIYYAKKFNYKKKLY